MALEPGLGEQAFAELLRRYPDDGIVFYERGEAFEYSEDLQRAREDYERAEELLPLPHWKTIARMAIQRVTVPESFKTAPPQWLAFHDVHETPEAPP
jgi:tetratricopeptide (TPR) repeat protein